jgi:hypothetical protein
MRPSSAPSPLATCQTLKFCSKKRRAASLPGFDDREAALHGSRHGSRAASAPQLAIKADHASATTSPRHPGKSLNDAARKVTPGAAAIAAGDGAIAEPCGRALLAGGSAAGGLGGGAVVGAGL